MSERDILVLSSALSIMGLWIFWFWIYRDYCVDTFRQELFKLRDEIFLEAAKGQLFSFDLKAYGLLRMTVNGFIRYGHRLNLLQPFIMYLIAGNEVRSQIENFHSIWDQEISAIAPDVRQKLIEYKERMNFIVVSYLIKSSVFLFLIFIIQLISLAMFKKLVRFVVGKAEKILDDMDSTAMSFGQ